MSKQLKRSEFLEIIDTIAKYSEDNLNRLPEEAIAARWVKESGLPTRDLDGKSNPIIVAIVYARNSGMRLNVYTPLELMVVLEKAWEYYNSPEAQSSSEVREDPSEVSGRFGPMGNMQGSDHPFRRD